MRKLRLYGAASIQPTWSRLADQVIARHRQVLQGKELSFGSSDLSGEGETDKRESKTEVTVHIGPYKGLGASENGEPHL